MARVAQMEKIEVKVDWETDLGDRSYLIRFTAEEVDSFEIESADTELTLYRDYAGGYLVYEVDNHNGDRRLFPEGYINQYTGLPEYEDRYTAEEIAEHYPQFAEAVGEVGVIDID